MRRILFILTAIITNAYIAHADDGVLTPDTAAACETIPANMYATYSVNQYTCAVGNFLPADAITCATCPADGLCSGGTFPFNQTEFQGLILPSAISATTANACADNFPSEMHATYSANQYTCSAGYYLPADAIACTKCPANSYCPGGTYSFNETLPQGIVSCASGLYAPAGMSSADQCGHILHIGGDVMYLRSVKKTTPSLNAKIGNDIFYGNMTVADVAMNAATTRKLKVSYGGVTYSIYDDTINPE